MQLGQLIAGTEIKLATPALAAARICDITEDSRTVVPGSLFVARKGLKFDGCDKIPEAIERGAVAILCRTDAAPTNPPRAALLTSHDVPRDEAILAQRFFASPAANLALAGVTGTNGKTTVCHFIHQLLNHNRKRAGLIGTVCIDDGVECADATLTTPGSIEIAHSLANMRDAGYSHAVIEASSHALAQRRLAALRFDAAVFTNLSGEHLDYHSTMDEYARAKSILFHQLAPGATAILNTDDPRARDIAASVLDDAVLSCSLDPMAHAHCTARTIEHRTDGSTEVELTGPWGEINQAVPFFGSHNLINCLQAVAAAHTMGVEPATIDAALPTLHLPPGRLEQITLTDSPTPIRVYVDYAHTDDALHKLLSAIKPTVRGKLVVAFGCGGDRDKEKRPRSAAVVCKYADEILVTVNDAHTESPSSIIRDILAGMTSEWQQRALVSADRATAIHQAIASANPGDAVVIAGKGHEKVQFLPDGAGGEVRVPFSDADVARDALGAWATEHADAEPAP